MGDSQHSPAMELRYALSSSASNQHALSLSLRALCARCSHIPYVTFLGRPTASGPNPGREVARNRHATYRFPVIARLASQARSLAWKGLGGGQILHLYQVRESRGWVVEERALSTLFFLEQSADNARCDLGRESGRDHFGFGVGTG